MRAACMRCMRSEASIDGGTNRSCRTIPASSTVLSRSTRERSKPAFSCRGALSGFRRSPSSPHGLCRCGGGCAPAWSHRQEGHGCAPCREGRRALAVNRMRERPDSSKSTMSSPMVIFWSTASMSARGPSRPRPAPRGAEDVVEHRPLFGRESRIAFGVRHERIGEILAQARRAHTGATTRGNGSKCMMWICCPRIGRRYYYRPRCRRGFRLLVATAAGCVLSVSSFQTVNRGGWSP